MPCLQLREGETILGSIIPTEDTDCPQVRNIQHSERQREENTKGLNQMERKYGRRLKVVVFTNVKISEKGPSQDISNNIKY